MSLNDGRERIIWLDALRVVACFGVVTIHVVAPLIQCVPPGSAAWWTCSMTMSLVSSSVLVFVLISGTLFLGRPCHEDVPGFFARRMRFMAQVLFWTVFYMVLRCMSERDLSWSRLLTDLFYGSPYYHLWFLYMIAGLYLVTPSLCRYVRKVQRPVRMSIVLFLMVCVCVLTLAENILSFRLFQNIVLLFIPFIPFFLLGHELRMEEVGVRFGKTCLGSFLVTVVALPAVVSVCLSRHYGEGVVSWLFGSFSIFVMVMAICIFRFFNAVRDARILALTARLSPVTLGTYVLHPLFLPFFDGEWFAGLSLKLEIAVVVRILVVFAWSAATAWAIGRIPYIRGLVISGR